MTKHRQTKGKRPEKVDPEAEAYDLLPRRRIWPSGAPYVTPTPRSWLRKEAEK